jgi:hypothetical protein
MNGIPVGSTDRAAQTLIDLLSIQSRMPAADPEGTDVARGRGGRPATRFTTLKKAEYLQKLRAGFRRGTAATAVGVTRWTVNEAKKGDQRFAAACVAAEAEGCELVEDALVMAARSGNVTAMIFYLTNRAPDRWQDRRNHPGRQIPWVDEAVREKAAMMAQQLSQLHGREFTTEEVLDTYRAERAALERWGERRR